MPAQKKRVLLAGFVALGFAGTASAADLAVKAPVVYAPAFTWTGCYLGGNGGWIGSNESYETSPGLIGPRLPNQDRLPPFDLARRSFSSDESAGTVGGQFGCQWQMGSWVVGAEWDWNWSGLEEDDTASFGRIEGRQDSIPRRTEHHHKQLDWFMTARARLGWAAWDRFLIYATGGLAWGAYDAYTNVTLDFRNEIGGTIIDPTRFAHFNGGYREKRVGYAVGGGFEWAFANNWTAKAEFLYLDFGSFDYISPTNSVLNNDPNDPNNVAWRTHVDAQEYVVRVGINYLFNLGGPPVVARY